MEILSGTVRRQLSYNLLILNANNINTRITLSWTKISFSTKGKYLIEAMSARLSHHNQTWLQSGMSGQRNEQSQTKSGICGPVTQHDCLHEVEGSSSQGWKQGQEWRLPRSMTARMSFVFWIRPPKTFRTRTVHHVAQF